MADNAPQFQSNRTENGNVGRGDKNASSRNQRGGRGQGGRGRGSQSRGRGKGFGSNSTGGRHKKAEQGRGAWSRNNLDKRKRNDEEIAKREKAGPSNEYAGTQFSKEEIEAEGRKPKKKVAVLIGYAGSGYKGMQINGAEKTIEGDIFKGFVAAGAISKANADDPKKSSLVRCARTDKGVHAAGNVISLKLIVEDPDIVYKINENLPPQIRVWGIERTNGAFSCYQSCDSRWYEYLIPTYSFIPPHPKSFMGMKLAESVEKEGVLEEWRARQADAADFWEKAEAEYVKPILKKLDPDMQMKVMAIIHSSVEEGEPEVTKKQMKKAAKGKAEANTTKDIPTEMTLEAKPENSMAIGSESQETTVLGEEWKANIDGSKGIVEPVPSPEGTDTDGKRKADEDLEDTVLAKKARTDTAGHREDIKEIEAGQPKNPQEPVANEVELRDVYRTKSTISSHETTVNIEPGTDEKDQEGPSKSILTPLEAAVKEVKAAYITAKKAYRISDSRRDRVQDSLNSYLGTRNFHNYTIQKTFSDPSAKRVIRSFKVGSNPVIINDTEWLSLKVHGQSFMMHQIRKMVAMVALIVRCGTNKSIIEESYGPCTISIPKAPGLGLLLERPVFDTYNEQAVTKFEREKIDFDKFEKEMEEFKQREIYDRIFREEERDHQFHTFFHHIDHYRTDFFLWVTAGGVKAARQSKARSEVMNDAEEDSEPDANGQEG
ncbi:pseudouridine synthase [Tricladium varicosporioides]|nr:pseudouridine synthase [Hymenoscyphus varicosporioides]